MGLREMAVKANVGCGRAYSHRIGLADLKCVSPKRGKRWPPGWGKSLAARGEETGARGMGDG